MLQYFKPALWGTIFVIAGILGHPATAEPQGCVMEQWETYLDPDPQEFDTVETIDTEDGTIISFKFGEIAGDYGKVFLFLLDDGECFTRAVSFGSYEATNAYAVEAGDAGPDGRLYHGDLYNHKATRHWAFSKPAPHTKQPARLR